jgi:hypothetical protein
MTFCSSKGNFLAGVSDVLPGVGFSVESEHPVGNMNKPRITKTAMRFLYNGCTAFLLSSAVMVIRALAFPPSLAGRESFRLPSRLS